MLHLTKGLTENIYFTGAENRTVLVDTYSIQFKNRVTLEQIGSADLNDISPTTRYQQVIIDVNSIFLNSTTGFWDYFIYDDAGIIVEIGFMYLHPSTNFAPTEYTEQVNTFVTYNGK
jgi:hypothetical protein